MYIKVKNYPELEMLKELMEYMSGLKMTVISAVFLFISLGLMFAGIELAVDPVWITILISGTPIVHKAVCSLWLNRRISSPLLITTAMFAAIAIGELFAAGEVALIMAVGEILEDITVDKAKRGMNRLLKLSPTQGRIIMKNSEKIVPLSDIRKGDILRVLPGETIPADAIITRGTTSVNQAILTGESLPVDKTEDDNVMAGTINCFGAIDIQVQSVKDTYLQKMINLVREAQNNKAPTQKIVDKWAAILVPAAMITALLAYLITGEIIRGVTVLVVFCPCALVLATPTSIMAAIGQATKHGILVKSGAALEEMGKIDTIVFDKTGTLTTGEIRVADIISFNKKTSAEKLLALTAGLECLSEHALGKAVVQKAQQEKIKIPLVRDFCMVPGRGVCGLIGNRKFFAGNAAFMKENNISLALADGTAIKKLQSQGKALIFLGDSEKAVGIIALADTARSDAKEVLAQLQNEQINTIILTGDNAPAAKYFAKGLSVRHIFANLLPQNKVEKIINLQQSGHRVCMVGDGINDAPALKTANIGIAMGHIGSDIAIDAADITLINDKISSIPYLKKLSILTLKTIQTNITFSMVLNFIGVVLSFYGVLGPMSGAIMHNAGSILVIINASRLYYNSPDYNFPVQKNSYGCPLSLKKTHLS